MDNLIIEPTEDQPKLEFFSKSGKLTISGKSLPEDVTSFYNPVLQWLKEYSLEPAKITELNVKLTYFNTASSKLILDILMALERIQENNGRVLINWYYPYYDDDMKEAGKEYAEMVDLEFKHISYTP